MQPLHSPIMNDVLVSHRGALGRLTLNRPKALNALDLDMVRSIDGALSTWEEDPTVVVVLIDGAGERSFCAGGDIRALHDCCRMGNWDDPARFFAEEYRLNARLARYPKPIVSVMHGLTMGGGIGLGGHVRHRIVTADSKLAMPEVGIGFIPDVGGTHLLGTAPGEIGTYAALTGTTLGPADAMACGLADLALSPSNVAALPDYLGECGSDDDVEALLRHLAGPAGVGLIASNRGWIDRCFASDTVESIVSALIGAPDFEARAAGALIQTKCPMSLIVTLRALRTARAMRNLDRCLEQELRLSLRVTRRPDFVEGVRAAVVDKDRQPRWRPARLPDVDGDEVEAQFAPLAAVDQARTAAR